MPLEVKWSEMLQIVHGNKQVTNIIAKKCLYKAHLSSRSVNKEIIICFGIGFVKPFSSDTNRKMSFFCHYFGISPVAAR